MSRSLDDHLPSSLGAPSPMHKNLDPTLHPHIRSREYVRAVQASKLDRLFAKPFIGQLEGHRDGVYALAKDPKALARMASGSGDGEVRVWELGAQSCVMALTKAHKGKVAGLAFLPARVDGEGRSRAYDEPSTSRRTLDEDEDEIDLTMDVDDEEAALRREEEAMAEEEAATASRLGSRKLLSCGSDKVVKLWDVAGATLDGGDRLVGTYHGQHGFNAIDHHPSEPMFATASDRLHIWDVNQSVPSLLPCLFVTDGLQLLARPRPLVGLFASTREHLTSRRPDLLRLLHPLDRLLPDRDLPPGLLRRRPIHLPVRRQGKEGVGEGHHVDARQRRKVQPAAAGRPARGGRGPPMLHL